MAEVLWNIFETAVNLFESCVAIHFICVFLDHDFTTAKGKAVYITGVLTDFAAVSLINCFIDYEGVLGVIYVTVYFLFAAVFLNGTIIKKIFTAVIANSAIIVVSAFVTGAVSSLSKSDYSVIYAQNSFERVCSVVSVQILLIMVYDLILKYKVTSLNSGEWRLVLSILGISFLSLAFIHITLVNSTISREYIRLLVMSEAGIIFLNAVTFYMTYALSKSNSEAQQLRIQKQQNEYRAQYSENIKNQYEEIHRIRHDMKQNIAVISALYQSKKYKEAEEYANKISDKLTRLDIIINVGNDFINAILNSKLSAAKEAGIEVLCASSSNVSGIEDTDLCSLLGNMLDNAIEAAQKCSHGFIDISIKCDKENINIIISNSVNKPVLKSNSLLATIKSNKKLHGYGVKTIRSIVKKYNGMVSFFEKNNLFYCMVIIHKQRTDDIAEIAKLT